MQEKLADKEKEVIVVGYPRSGNTWLARMLGEYLDSPVTGYKNAKPLATEGLGRKGGFVVRQLHVLPKQVDSDDFLVDGWVVNPSKWMGENIVFIVRDPRDIAVSAMFYWGKTLEQILNAMINGVEPLKIVGAWVDFVDAWLSSTVPFYLVSYEDLYVDQGFALYRLLRRMGLAEYYDKKIVNTYRNQMMENKRAQVELDGNTRPYGRTIQLHHLRKGQVGDWKNHFDEQSLELAEKHFKHIAVKKLGYIW